MLSSLVAVLTIGVVTARLSTGPAYPQTPEALEVKARAERLSDDKSASGGVWTSIRNKFLVQRLSYTYQELAGSCSGFPDQPKEDPSYDRYVDVTEIGLFGIPITSWHAVCGGRIPLRGPVLTASSQADWAKSVEAASLANCKKNHLPCGYLGDFRDTPHD